MTGWPERVRTMQANWIGRSQGVRFAFRTTSGATTAHHRRRAHVRVHDPRRHDHGVTFCAVAAEHPLATHAAKSNPALAAFVDECKRGSVMEADSR